jgi:hypothetical protein
MGDLLTERAFWRDPVQVFTAATCCLIGVVIGFVIGALL